MWSTIVLMYFDVGMSYFWVHQSDFELNMGYFSGVLIPFDEWTGTLFRCNELLHLCTLGPGQCRIQDFLFL